MSVVILNAPLGAFFWGIVDWTDFYRSSNGYRNGTLRRHHHRGGQHRVGATNRLSENADRSVLLIEAGPDYQTADSLPFELVNSHRNALKDHDWGLATRPPKPKVWRFQEAES